MKRIDAIFHIECEFNGLDADTRLAAREKLSRPLVKGLHEWLQEERAKTAQTQQGGLDDQLHVRKRRPLAGLRGSPR